MTMKLVSELGADDLSENYILERHVTLAGSDLGDDDDVAVLETSDDLGTAQRSGPSARQETTKTSDKKRKRKEATRDQQKKKRKTDGGETTSSPACHPPKSIADYLVSAQKRTFRNVSQMELDDMSIPENSILDTTPFGSHQRNLNALQEFFRTVTPRLHARLTQKPQHYGAPTAILLCGSALRVIDVVRKCRKLPGEKGGEVAKLFAKHIKLQEQIDYLHKTRVSLAIGTPDRIGKLLASQALQTTALTHVVLDVTHRDAKNRSILDINEVSKEVFKSVLGHDGLRDLIQSGKVQLVLF